MSFSKLHIYTTYPTDSLALTEFSYSMGALQTSLFIQSTTPVTVQRARITSMGTDVLRANGGTAWSLSLWAMSSSKYEHG